jgi:YVTN family beta-propeller protein
MQRDRVWLRGAVFTSAVLFAGARPAPAQTVTTAVSVAGIGAPLLAVNPVTNKIYALGFLTDTIGPPGVVTVIDGATNATTTVNVGNQPLAVAVNPVTNQIYVANSYSNTVTVIDGATNATTTVNVGNYPDALAVNPVTNQIYVGNGGAPGSVTVIDGATNATTSVSVPSAVTMIASTLLPIKST